MVSTLRTALTEARARRTARHLAGLSFCDSCAQVSDRADRAAELRQQTQLSALTHIR
ncbi:hypothetical protein ACIQPS_33700 [Streptomyces sp. NPDC091290]|uniref:hypothetical protein n=1 Tax=Streptomyces sp. NPDC091290 TaxID=3365990 RepID=UPI003826C4EF